MAKKITDAPLDQAGIDQLKQDVQDAVDGVISGIQAGDVTHDDAIDQVSEAVLALKTKSDMGSMVPKTGLGDMESMAEDQGGAESEQGQGE